MSWAELHHFVNQWGKAIRTNGAEPGGPAALLWPLGFDMAVMRLDDAGIVRIAAHGRDFSPVVPRDQLLGRPYQEAVPEPLRRTLRCAIEDALAFGQPVPYRYRCRHAGIERLRIGWVAPGPIRGVTILVRDFGVVRPKGDNSGQGE